MELTGVFVPLITPLDSAGEVALDALEGLAHQVVNDGAAGVVALGTTAEPGSLTDREQAAVIDVAARVCRERGALLLVGAANGRAVAALGSRPEVAAALSVVPPYVRPGEAGVEAHFRALAAASPVPLVIYHIPYRTGQSLSPATLRRLAEVPNVVGVKYSTGGIDADAVTLLGDLPDGFAVLGGDDVVVSALLALGASGAVLASAHLATAEFVRLVDAWRAGDVRLARPLGLRLAALSDALFAAPSPTVLKAVLHACGRIPTPAVRLPLLAAEPFLLQVAMDRLAHVTATSTVVLDPVGLRPGSTLTE